MISKRRLLLNKFTLGFETLYNPIAFLSSGTTQKSLSFVLSPSFDSISFMTAFCCSENLKLFGSQGQQRTAALSLKLAEIELVRKKIGENPVLLLDDVLSELDRKRQHQLLNSMEGIQTMITCTGLEEFVGDRKKFNQIFHVVNGVVNDEEDHPLSEN